jgi:hypothetical protein
VKASRRAILAAGAVAPAVALGAAPAVGANPDAALIRMVDDFIARHRAMEAATAPLMAKGAWTQEDDALWAASRASATGYHETLAEIAQARPVTLDGLTAQALATAWHFRFEDDGYDDGDGGGLALVLAHGVLALAGKPLPAWAEKSARETREARDARNARDAKAA